MTYYNEGAKQKMGPSLKQFKKDEGIVALWDEDEEAGMLNFSWAQEKNCLLTGGSLGTTPD